MEHPTPFKTFGEQLHSIMKAANSGGTDPRLLQIRAALDGGSETVPSDGGFLVQSNFAMDLVKRMYDVGEIFGRCMQVTIDSNGFAVPQFSESSRANGSRLGGIQVYWENEGQVLKPSPLVGTPYTQKPSFTRSKLTPKKLVGFLHVTNELSWDSNAFERWATYAFATELMFTLENCIVNGTGSGQPLGVMNSPALITVVPEPGQQSGTVISQNIDAMLANFWSHSFNNSRAVWLYNQALLPQLSRLSTQVQEGGSESKLWQWALAPDTYDMLGGFPALVSEYCQFPGTAGDIMLVDFSRYIVAIRELLRAQISIHLRFLTDENTFRFVMRIDGQPIDQQPVIALNAGSPPAISSPFVALGPRP